jgi:hypothetical protein
VGDFFSHGRRFHQISLRRGMTAGPLRSAYSLVASEATIF